MVGGQPHRYARRIAQRAHAPLAQFAADGLAPFLPRWHALHAYAGREVVLLEQGIERARGIATGIDGAGQLLLDTPDGMRAIAAGDVSLREAQ